MSREAGVNALMGMGLALQLMIMGTVFLVLRFIWRKLFKKNSLKKAKQLEVKTKEKIGNFEDDKLNELAIDVLDSGNVSREAVTRVGVARKVKKETYMTNFFFLSLSIYSLGYITLAVANSWDSPLWWGVALGWIIWLSQISATAVRGESFPHFCPTPFYWGLSISFFIMIFLENISSWQLWLCAFLLSYFLATLQYLKGFN